MEQVWKRLYNKDRILVYEGFTIHNSPYGAGTSYFENGNKYQEGGIAFIRKAEEWKNNVDRFGDPRFRDI